MSTKKEIEQFQQHFKWMLTAVYFVWKYKYVFVVMGVVWAVIGASIIRFTAPYIAPFVLPTIDFVWTKHVAPYDSMTVDFEARLKNLEGEHFPEAKQ